MANTEIFYANLVNMGELKAVGENNHVLNINTAENVRRFNKETQEWVDDEPVWRRVTLWGRQAVNFANSDVKPGTPLVVEGRREARKLPAYTTPDGRELPERTEDHIIASHIGVEIGPFNVITGTGKANNSDMSGGGTTKSAPKKTASKKASPEKAKESANSIFGTTEAGSSTSIFDSEF